MADIIDRVATGLVQMGVKRGERVAFYLDKRFETVATAFGTAYAGAVFVPVNPLLKAEQSCSTSESFRDAEITVGAMRDPESIAVMKRYLGARGR